MPLRRISVLDLWRCGCSVKPKTWKDTWGAALQSHQSAIHVFLEESWMQENSVKNNWHPRTGCQLWYMKKKQLAKFPSSKQLFTQCCEFDKQVHLMVLCDAFSPISPFSICHLDFIQLLLLLVLLISFHFRSVNGLVITQSSYSNCSTLAMLYDAVSLEEFWFGGTNVLWVVSSLAAWASNVS